MSEPLLKVDNLAVHYGGIQAVKGISLEVKPGETVALIGANGAGKSSTLNALMGLVPCTGQLRLRNADLLTQPAHERIRHGMGLVPEGRGIFGRMSIHENLLIGAHHRRHASDVNEDLERMYALFPRLQERQGQLAGSLSGGEQQMLAMARALMAHPTLLLLDEPSMGLAPIIVDQIFDLVQSIADQGTSILLVEQNARRALGISHRAYVMESGTVRLTGQSQDLLTNDEVRRAYLGDD